MRLAATLLFLFATRTAFAQDPTQQILLNQQAQLAMQQSQQAALQAQQAGQQAMDQSMQAAQAAACCTTPFAAAPQFSLKPGNYAAGTIVRLKDRTRGAAIYYTTDGWTPTTHSMRYVGPILLSSTSVLQAIAVAPNCQASMIASAIYTVPGSAVPVPPSTDPSAHTVVLTFTEPVNSSGLQIGDPLPIALAEDLTLDNQVTVPKGTAVFATVTEVDRPGVGGAPGTITFAVHSVSFHDRTIALAGEESKQGSPRVKTVQALMFIPYLGMGGILVHGKDVTIPSGATLTARVEGVSLALTAANR